MGILEMSIMIFIFIISMYLASLFITTYPLDFSLTSDKLSSYECGFPAMGHAHIKFEVLFYIIGLLYLIFDLELIFLFPIATILFSLSSILAFLFVITFLIIITLGFIYEFFIGALDII
jgi:NADH-quinone oxidoreductase subunit A